jgi:menaquinone-9 beta-reductase
VTSPLIVGGGPAGAAAAIMLAQSGIKPLVLERNRETGDAICGGFISWRTLETLRALGLEQADLGGHAIHRLRLFAGKLTSGANLPHAAIGISRQRLDTLLLRRAEMLGARVERGVMVREILPGAVRTDDGATLDANSLFLASGKHDVRGAARPKAEGNTLGLRTLLDSHPALTALVGDSIELHLFEGGYCGVLINETGQANLCMAVRKSRLANASGDPAALLLRLGIENPALGERLAFASSGGIDAISAIPYGWIARDTLPGLFRLGDQAAVIPSLAGEGNGIALASGMAAARAWQEGGADAAAAYQRRFARAARRPVNTAMRLWHWGEKPVAARFATRITALFPRIAAHFAAMTRIEP